MHGIVLYDVLCDVLSDFHARHIDMPMSLNGIEHMYMVAARVYMMF
jgi:hypothetical protein